jgi:branched-chain amino acid transport system substrate-binding protein
LNTIRLVFVWLVGISGALAQDAPVIVIGAVISQSGAQADLGTEYARGIEVWRDAVNAGGGLLGRRVELRELDDGSFARRNAELYARLIRDEKVDLLIGPYGSAATLIAAGEAERARRVMVNGAGPAAVVQGRGPRYLFQSTIPYSAYGAGVLEIAAEAGFRRLLILARDEPGAVEAAEAALAAAGKTFTVGAIEVYRPGLTNFATQVAKARAAQAEAWIAFGDVREAAEMVKTFRKLDYAPPLFFVSGASHPRLIALLGQDAEGSLGAVDFDPHFGAAARAFAKAFAAKWNVQPGFPAAQGYVAGTVLAGGVRSAGTLNQDKLRAALAELEVKTLFGDYRVAPDSGVQTGAKPMVTQILKGRRQVVWPPAAETAKWFLPYPRWEERTLYK